MFTINVLKWLIISLKINFKMFQIPFYQIRNPHHSLLMEVWQGPSMSSLVLTVMSGAICLFSGSAIALILLILNYRLLYSLN
jgi:hypothetical protein